MGGEAIVGYAGWQDAAPSRNADRGPLGFRLATVLLAAAVLVSAVSRLILQYQALGHLSRPWSPAVAVVLAVAVMLLALPVRMGWARLASLLLAAGVLAVEAVLLLETLTGVIVPGLDGVLSGGSAELSLLPNEGRPSALTSLLSIIIAAATVGIGWSTRLAVWVSCWSLVLVSSASGFLLMELAFPNRFRVEDYFQTSPGAITSSTLMLLGLAAAAICARPYRLPLGPFLTTRTWPLAVVCLGALAFGSVVSQIAYRLVREANGNLDSAQLVAFLVQGAALLAVVAFTVWYAALQQRRVATATFANVVYRAAVPMAILDHDGVVRDVNPAYEQFLGRPAHEVRGTRWDAYAQGGEGVVPHDAGWWDELLRGGVARTERREYLRPDQTTVWADVTVAAAQDAGGDGKAVLLEQMTDVTAAKVAQQQLSFQSRHDPLTGLMTRQEITELLDANRNELPRVATLVAVFDLDNFKVVNGVYGHFVGDQVLTEIARRLVLASGPRGHVGRLGGDQFVYVQHLPLADWARSVRRSVETLMVALEHDCAVSGFVIRTTASMGVEVGLRDESAADLLRNASVALAMAKRAGGRRWQMFDDSFHTRAREQMLLLEQLQALFRDQQEEQLETWFQPIVDLNDLGTVGYEALVRWRHPARGVMSAGTWIETAETDLAVIHAISLITLRQSMEFAAGLPPGQRVSVNVSGAHLSSREFPEFAELARELHRRDPTRLIIELTETTLANLTNPGRVRLSQLIDSGIGLWADDFGTGYSSVAHLRDLPLTGIKLDKSFVADLDDPDSPVYQIADGLAGLAEGLGLTTVAEGIETPRQAQRAAAAGWALGQGWLFGRPNVGGHWSIGHSAAGDGDDTASSQERQRQSRVEE